MCKEDVAQITKIDCETFPSQWPPPNYQHELRNRLNHYIVSCDEEKTVAEYERKTFSENDLTEPASPLKRLSSRLRLLINKPPPSVEHIVGFAGFWILDEEAHITNIAVREAYRRQGIGELLLISLIDLATELKARIITLEVRVSNTTAQSLYTKYGFAQAGIHRGYYLDNREDALLMSTQDITSVAFQTYLQQLKQAYARRCGMVLSQIAR
ncbi:ribosomal protein S18-alanine N-acetyltransferase [Chloroflexota bacterium]